MAMLTNLPKSLCPYSARSKVKKRKEVKFKWNIPIFVSLKSFKKKYKGINFLIPLQRV